MPGSKAVINGNVVESITDGDVEDFANRIILWSRKDYPPLDLFRVGEPVDITYRTAHVESEINCAIQGGPFLLFKGRVAITTEQNDIGKDIAIGRSARTAVGIDDSGRLFLVVVEGPGSDRSIGSTLQELAATMQDFGATWAMNLDGGSSSAMALRFAIPKTTLPCGNRKVATALVLVDKAVDTGHQPYYF